MKRLISKCKNCPPKRIKGMINFAKAKCNNVAQAYFFGVRGLGRTSFMTKAQGWCSDCAKEGGDPVLTKDSSKSVDKQFDMNKLQRGSKISDDDVYEEFFRDFNPDDYENDYNSDEEFDNKEVNIN